MRVQLALNVKNLDDAIAHYSKMFGVQPHKIREGYANFAVENPPLKLVLFERPGASERLNYLGIESFDHADVDVAEARFTKADILDSPRQRMVCCHAEQDKVYAKETDGLRWEWYVVNDEMPEIKPDTKTCCQEQEAQVAAEICCEEPATETTASVCCEAPAAKTS